MGVLRRRGEPGERESQVTPGEVLLWTNHRVMEWLRHVDLSEYAPNLRGSGVHGALLVMEKRFTAELLASLLSIPSSKSLLRLIAPDVQLNVVLFHFPDDTYPSTSK